MYKSVVCEGENLLAEVQVQQCDPNFGQREKFEISHYTKPSERCTPLAVLHTISTSGICLKMKIMMEDNTNTTTKMRDLHTSLLREKKTAVILRGGEELHLVAMSSRTNKECPCFWGLTVPSGLYNSSLVMLNLRCLGIVFDLDETLIVANTMRSFEDRIEALQRKIASEFDPLRIAGMLQEIKRYQDDKLILKQYAENDQVDENGKVIKSQSELVPAFSDNHQAFVRPIIRLQDKNIILTRINPQIRDTSVLVRLRPAWEELRSYLTARGRKRFEVFVCTMAEREYALEMWRLLDPDANLISTKDLLNRIVCVKAGSRKSLFNVFQDGICDPKMALVIDDRLRVWDERDQPRVHVVPAFAPYYAPQAEANNAIPILCVARNVACSVRGGFFKEFDEVLLQRIQGVMYEDEFNDILPPDVSSYLISEDDTPVLGGNKETVGFDGMADAEVERRLKDVTASSAIQSTSSNLDPRIVPPIQPSVVPSPMPLQPPAMPVTVIPFANNQLPQVSSVINPLVKVILPETTVQNCPAREEGEVPESELDPDTRRRLLILQHGQDTRDQGASEPQFPVRAPMQAAVPRVQAHGGWFPSQPPMHMEKHPMHVEKQHPHQRPFLHKVENPPLSDRLLVETHRFSSEGNQRDDRLRLNQTLPSYPSFSGEEVPFGRSSSNRDLDFEAGRFDAAADTPVGALHDIAFKLGTKAEFRPALHPSTELKFTVEVLFAGEKISGSVGRTRREAQFQAAHESLWNLSDTYLSRINQDSNSAGDRSRYPDANDSNFVSDVNSFGYQPSSHKRQGSPRSFQGMSTKRFKPDYPRPFQRVPSSARY